MIRYVTSKTSDLLDHLASRPGHDEVKADFRELLVVEFGAERSALEFEKRVPVIRGRLDALIGRTVFEAKRDLTREWADVVRRMPDYLADREREEGEKFVGLASDGARWAAFEMTAANSSRSRRRPSIPNKPEVFLAWLDGIVALKVSLPPDPLTVRAELGRESLAFRRADAELAALWERTRGRPRRRAQDVNSGRNY